MSETFDLNLLPVARLAGGDHPELLGLHFAEAPRRPARGRDADRLILYLVLTGNAPLPPTQQEDTLTRLTKLYFDTPGSVTSGLRAVAEELNRLLLERNLHSANRQGIGWFTQAVLRGRSLFLAQSGPLHTFLITADETRDLYDPEMEDRGLGQSRSTPVAFSQVVLQANDTLILAAQPAPNWSLATLAGLHGQGPESLRRRLFAQNLYDVNAVLIQARPGKGKFFVHRMPAATPLSPASIATAPAAVPIPPAFETQVEPSLVKSPGADQSGDQGSAAALTPLAATVIETGSETAAPVSEETISEAAGSATFAGVPGSPVTDAPPDETLDQIPWMPLPAAQIERPSEEFSPASEMAATAPAPESLASKPTVRQKLGSGANKALAGFGAALAGLLRRTGQALRRLLGRMLPDESLLELPSYVMALVAIIIPVVMVTVAWYAYAQLGSSAQYELLMTDARQMVTTAAGKTAVLEQRDDLRKVLKTLDQAETYRQTPEIDTLRAQVISALDTIDMVKRIAYQPAIINGLALGVDVKRMVVSDQDLYLLDGASGNVIRAQFTDQGYQIDYAFQCGPSAAGSNLGTLVDITAWPAEYEPKASILAVDAAGGTLFCAPNQPAVRGHLTDPPNGQWNQIVALAQDSLTGDFYFLDPPANGVWIFWRSNFAEAPTFFFNEEIPNLEDVKDMEVSRGDLYLLHESGRLTLCTYTSLGVAPTRCSTPPYADLRPGRENTALSSANPFISILATQPPDPSLFFLEPREHALYHFSLRNLAFQQQYLSSTRLPSQPASAFAIDQVQRNIFLAFGPEVYYGVLP